VEVHTNNPFWKMSVVQVAASNAPGAFQTSFRGGIATVTNIGDLTMMLFKDRAPRSVDVFMGLSCAGFYNSNTIFHRVIPGFMIQGGCPLTNGTGGPIFRYDDEFHPRAIFSGSGQLALANSGRDTDGSQFFITLGQQRFLDFGYTLFGQLLRGFNVASNVISTPRSGSDRPFADVIITRASLVTNTTDMVITLTGTNLAGVVGTIQVIADDGLAGGRVTNTLTATTVADANNSQAFLKSPAITNLFLTAGVRYTNFIHAQDIEGNALYHSGGYFDLVTQNNATNPAVYPQGLAFTIVPGYSGPLKFYVYASHDPGFGTYDQQVVTFSVGDTAISALSTNLTARPLIGFTNQTLATFTNGIPNSPVGNFTALINWGDNSTNSGVIVTNVGGRKEIRGTHTYTNSGIYPIYVTIKSVGGAETNVVSVATVQPALTMTRSGTNTVLRWPAWAGNFAAQSHTNLATTTWVSLTNNAYLIGYENVVTNGSSVTNRFYRLRR
jgi:cyclophilin family peptidyl-prolyl cis-trans isomerase